MRSAGEPRDTDKMRPLFRPAKNLLCQPLERTHQIAKRAFGEIGGVDLFHNKPIFRDGTRQCFSGPTSQILVAVKTVVAMRAIDRRFFEQFFIGRGDDRHTAWFDEPLHVAEKLIEAPIVEMFYHLDGNRGVEP